MKSKPNFAPLPHSPTSREFPNTAHLQGTLGNWESTNRVHPGSGSPVRRSFRDGSDPKSGMELYGRKER